MTTETATPLIIADELDRYIAVNVLDDSPHAVLTGWYAAVNRAVKIENGSLVAIEAPITSEASLNEFYSQIIEEAPAELKCVLIYQIWLAVRNRLNAQRNTQPTQELARRL